MITIRHGGEYGSGSCSISGPDTKATLSLYADTILLGFVLEVFLII